MGILPTIALSEKTKLVEISDEYILPKQSANVLFNFMKKLDYLKDILSNKAIIPRYYEEKISYLNIEGFNSISFPMTCFCDIHLNRLVTHMEFYGEYGIGLSKKWAIEQGVQPIHYINEKSPLNKDFTDIFSRSLDSSESEYPPIVDSYKNYLLTSLLFMKPIQGRMPRDNKTVEKNFHDEREWRYVPNLYSASTGLPQIIPQHSMNAKAYVVYLKALARHEILWLKFEYESIKHLVVSTEVDREELIKFIRKCKKIKGKQKFLLISRILVFNELKEDW